MSIDITTFARTRQSYEVVCILTVNEPVSVLRATVKVDAYAEQSFARVERFDGAQWHEVLTELGTVFHADMPSYVTRDDSTSKLAAEKVATPLIELAARIIAEARGSY